ncbi:MAG: hypothetical protein ACJ77K_17665 [Bacteroidia bacterium]|jgi:hypothetical protein
MDERKANTEFSEADFFELVKDDPEAIAEYKKEVVELYSQRIYSEVLLIKLVTGKTKAEVYRDYSLPELMHLNWALDFLKDNPCGNFYINKLLNRRRSK